METKIEHGGQTIKQIFSVKEDYMKGLTEKKAVSCFN